MSARLRTKQAATVAAIEWRRTLTGRRTFVLALFCILPALIGLIRMVVFPEAARLDVGRTTHELAQTFALFHLRFIVFFACAFLFVRSFRGEVLHHTLHLSFLLPIRRLDLIVGKYFGALAVALVVMLPSTVTVFVSYYLANGVGNTLQILTSARGLGHLASYLGVTILAAAGYGALFLLAGLFFKNPMIPAALYLGFELVAPYLPFPIRIFSIARHLLAMMPVPVTLGPLAVTGTDSPGWVAAVLIVGVAAVTVGLAGWRAKVVEVDYS